MLIMTSLIRVGQSPFSTVPIDEDSVERITICLQSLASLSSQEQKPVKEIFLEDTQKAYAKMVANEEMKAAEKRAKSSTDVKVQPDDLISFRQFKKKQGDDMDEVRSIPSDLPRFRV
jgi:coatomer subunit beta